MDDGGKATPLSPSHILVRPSREDITFGGLEAQHLHRFNYILGIDSLTNNSARPSNFTNPANPLAA